MGLRLRKAKKIKNENLADFKISFSLFVFSLFFYQVKFTIVFNSSLRNLMGTIILPPLKRIKTKELV